MQKTWCGIRNQTWKGTLQKEPCKRILAKGTLRKASSQKEMNYFEKKCKIKMHLFFSGTLEKEP